MALANLIIQTAFVGDALLSIPLIKALRKFQPDHPIGLVCRKPVGDFFIKTKLVDRVFEVNKASRASVRQLQADLRAREFHWILSPHESLRSAMLAFSLKAEKKVGYKKWWNAFAFDTRVERPMPLPEALRQMALLAPFDQSVQKNLEEFAQLWSQVLPSQGPESSLPVSLTSVPSWASMQLERSLFLPLTENVTKLWSQVGEGPVVFLAPGSVWNTKMWTTEGFVEVGKWHQQKGAQVILIGSPGEKEICEQVSLQIPGSLNFAGATSLYEMAQMLSQGSVLYCNDSGAMHMASVVGLPAVSMFGPTTPHLGYRPWQDQAWIMQVPMGCRPCGRHGAKACPIGTHACMKEISAPEVLKAGEHLMRI